jgi:hypothetical protein
LPVKPDGRLPQVEYSKRERKNKKSPARFKLIGLERGELPGANGAPSIKPGLERLAS